MSVRSRRIRHSAWKATLHDLDQRLGTLSPADVTGFEAWRADAEDLRSAIMKYAETHTDVQIEIPDSLPGRPALDALKTQLDKLTTAVDGIIKQTRLSKSASWVHRAC